jgi:hypothetical protein
MMECMRIHKFRFDQHFQQYDAAVFLSDFFACPAVFENVEVLKNTQGNWGKYAAAPKDIEGVVFEEVATTKLSMDFFDRLSDAGLLFSFTNGRNNSPNRCGAGHWYDCWLRPRGH